MTEQHEPELGQLVSGVKTGEYAIPGWVRWMLLGIFEYPLRTTYWNEHQSPLSDEYLATWPFAEWRRYWWGDEEAPEAALPNFTYADVEIRWYKHAGRSMSCNVEMTPDEWAVWAASLLGELQEHDRKTREEAGL